VDWVEIEEDLSYSEHGDYSYIHERSINLPTRASQAERQSGPETEHEVEQNKEVIKVYGAYKLNITGPFEISGIQLRVGLLLLGSTLFLSTTEFKHRK